MRNLAIVMALWLGVTAAQEPVFRGGVKLVELLVTVRDKKGGFPKDLKQSDFKVLEDGKHQEIQGFAHDLDVPLTIGMLVDVSGSVANQIPEERRAAKRFFEQVLRPQDKAFVISFGGKATLLQDLTGSMQKLEQGLEDVVPPDRIVNVSPPSQAEVVFAQFPGGGPRFPLPIPPQRRPVPRGPGGGGGRNPGGWVMIGGTVLYDAVFLAADEVLRPVDGRKAIILLTDGEDQGSKVTLNTALEMAQKYNVIIYSVQVRSKMGRNMPPLETLSTETGGRIYKLNKDLDTIFRDINNELRSQYSLSYVSSSPGRAGAFHQVEVEMVNKKYKAQARKGYYGSDSE